MTTAQIIALILLVLILIGAVWKKINIGILSLFAAFILLIVSDASADDVYSSFPANLVVLIIGVSLMFSHLELSGAVHWIINGAFRIVGDRRALIPWVGFALGGFLSTVGIFGTGPVAILVPIIAFISVKYPGTYLINALGVIMGSIGLGMSPLNPTGGHDQPPRSEGRHLVLGVVALARRRRSHRRLPGRIAGCLPVAGASRSNTRRTAGVPGRRG
ncbi:SLC13 family permease [Brevibacterium oceani]|uniref:SLC13 family permease n=1 Tax=Brevibacterium oceani TaxID=358099 RepID=UPI0015E65091|nr:SLC13 family permease [Brevibacterium oceani]